MHKEIIIPIYGCPVFIQVTNDMLAVNKYLDTFYGITEDLSDCRGIVFNKISPTYTTKIFIMLIPYNEDKKEYWDTIGHEMIHLIQDILEAKQIYFKRKDANEAYAYLQGHIMGDAYDLFEKSYSKFKRIKIK